ncbi:MAG TPA: rhodanese-like domain-containing protein [Polyangiaceae bacterium]|jgi:rhodanese-related sulfurtransferase
MVTRMALLVLGSALFFGCQSSHTEAGAQPTESKQAAAANTGDAVKVVSVDQVATLVQAKSATIVDANDSQTRQERGVIPGAVLLTNYRTYSLTELPAEKATKLVFYCGGTMCRASDGAAAKAAQAGYTDVSVMRDGIKGWRDSGQRTDMPRS